MAGRNKKRSRGAAPASYLGPPALLNGEDLAAYEALRDQFLDYVKPSDIFEQIYIHDIIDLQWEMMRWRRLSAALIKSEQYLAAKDHLSSAIGILKAVELHDGCRRGDPKAMEQVEAVLAKVGPSMDELAARTLARRLEQIESLNHLIATAEVRRAALVRELSGHREGLKRLLKGAIATVEGVEYKEVREKDDGTDGAMPAEASAKDGEAKAA